MTQSQTTSFEHNGGVWELRPLSQLDSGRVPYLFLAVMGEEDYTDHTVKSIDAQRFINAIVSTVDAPSLNWLVSIKANNKTLRWAFDEFWAWLDDNGEWVALFDEAFNAVNHRGVETDPKK